MILTSVGTPFDWWKDLGPPVLMSREVVDVPVFEAWKRGVKLVQVPWTWYTWRTTLKPLQYTWTWQRCLVLPANHLGSTAG